MRSSESIAEIAAALAEAQGKMKPAKMDGKNPHFGSRYATISSLIESIRAPFAEAGLSVVQGANESGGIDTTIMHKSGEWIELRGLTMRPTKEDPQGIGSMLTYARRYGLAAATGQVGDDDDDGNAACSDSGAASSRRSSPPSDHAASDSPPSVDGDGASLQHGAECEESGVVKTEPRLKKIKTYEVAEFEIELASDSKTYLVTCWHDAREQAMELRVDDVAEIKGKWNIYRDRVKIDAREVFKIPF